MALGKHIHQAASKGSPSWFKGNDKVIAGVCDGIAQRLEVDAIVARVTCVVLFISTAGLVAIPYVVLAFVLPKQPENNALVDVAPVSVVSDRYDEVVQAQKANGVKTPERYGIHADAGHVPPVPPQGEGINVDQKGVYIAYRHTETPEDHEIPRTNRVLIVVTVAIALLALLIAMANSIIARHPDLDIFNFWPELLIVAGTTLLVCFYDRLPFTIRITGLIFCVELTCMLLPFILGICPLHSLERVGFGPVILSCASIGCFIYFLVRKRPGALIAMVILFGLALVLMMGEIGLLERIMAASSYSKHNITSPLIRH